MTAEEIKSGKERILETAIQLFAKKGYAAVGVREIAEKADVNLSMISYYYQGKAGILKIIFEEFHNRYAENLSAAVDPSLQPDEIMRKIVYNMVDFVRAHTDLTMVAFNAIPLDIPEITEMKVKKVHFIIQTVSVLFGRLGFDPEDTMIFAAIGPSLLSSILAHFQFRSVQEKILNLKFDNAFYERYKEIMATVFIGGITKLADSHTDSKEE